MRTSGAWRTWLAIGATGFGGPAAQIALLHREVVERRRWLDEEEFLAAMRVCMLLPGPEAQQLATYAGWRIGGIPGGLLSGTLFVIPGALVVTSLAWLHAAGGSRPEVAAAFAGARPAVVALVALAAWRIAGRSLGTPRTRIAAALSLVAVVAGVPFPLLLAAAGAVGVATPRGDGTAPSSDAAGPGGFGITAPAAAPTSARQMAAVVAVAMAFWAAGFAAVHSLDLAGGRGAGIATLFTETTLLSFGGAYAVVPWALDESILRGWLEPAERFDALAMGEATPGPLILVTTFIGFLAGYRAAVPGDATAGFAGAAIATFFSFLPSFAMILALAPAVGSFHASPRIRGALAMIGAVIGAAIVVFGARLSLDAFAPAGRIEPRPIVVTIVAAAALWRGSVPAPVVVAAAAAVGVLLD